MQAHLLSNAASYIQFSWKKWDSVSKSYYSMGHSQQEANQTVLHKENTGSLKGVETKHTAALGLVTIGP